MSGKKFLKIFNASFLSSKPLFILEMANNHMGDLEHGLEIVRDFHRVTEKFDFHFAFKFQYRDISDTFIHPDYQKRTDLKYVKRFMETGLAPGAFLTLKKEIEKFGYISMCTPFDEKSVDLVQKHDYSIIKIASCSFTDWPLLERIVKTDKPIIASTGGANLQDIDRVVSFLHNRNKIFALLHCVSQYPAKEENLNLNKITFLKKRYSNTAIGFSGHEEPDNYLPVQLAIAEGAQILERHVAIKSDKYKINAYSSTPDQIEKWLEVAKKAFIICGMMSRGAHYYSEKETADERQFQRGVFAKESILQGELINIKKVFFAFPNQPGQLVANDMGKYKYYYAKKDIRKNEALTDVRLVDTREKVYSIVTKIDKLLKKAGVVFPNQVNLEISHHFGIEKFDKYGICIVTVVNRDYCKKLLIMIPGQFHPTQFHKRKEETFHVLYGKFIVSLNSKKHIYSPGDLIIIKPRVKHSLTTVNGGILEEISSTHFADDSFYEDKRVALNKNRKTLVAYWRNI